jgi:DNA-binding beta-propeller fold protein YncE
MFPNRLAWALVALAATACASAGVASAATRAAHGPAQAVFVLTDNPAGNQVVAYDRQLDGTLVQAGTYATGGIGGILAGSAVDHTASQGALAFDREHHLLLAVNPGSSSVSVFRVDDDRLALTQVVASGGSFPVSIAARDGLVYVLNALDGGDVQGYAVQGDRLLPLPGSTRALGLDPNAAPQFTHTPGQVAFTPDGAQLVVTTKANGNAIDVFHVDGSGLLSSSPTVNAEPGAVPFAVSFDSAGRLVVAEAGPNAVATFDLASDGTVTQVASVATNQAATCWIAPAGAFFYVSNAGSASESELASQPDGSLIQVGTAPTDAGTVDAAASPDGAYLYVQAGAQGLVDEFAVQPDGSLARIGSVTVPSAAGGEGIVVA